MFDIFLSFMDKGGPVMWVILAVSWLAFFLLFERLLRIAQWLRQAKTDLAMLRQQPEYEPGGQGIRSSPLAMLYHHIPWQQVCNETQYRQAVQTQLAVLMPRFEGMLPTIAVIGTLLPMLGLLGTVTGMIALFETIADHGTGNPKLMAEGISQALLTTAGGLISAIAVIFLHHYLSVRLRLTMALTRQALHMLQVHKFGNTHE